MKAKRRAMNAVLRVLRLLDKGMTHEEIDAEYGVDSKEILRGEFARKVRELFGV